jgi:hypothetical protein
VVFGFLPNIILSKLERFFGVGDWADLSFIREFFVDVPHGIPFVWSLILQSWYKLLKPLQYMISLIH